MLYLTARAFGCQAHVSYLLLSPIWKRMLTAFFGPKLTGGAITRQCVPGFATSIAGVHQLSQFGHITALWHHYGSCRRMITLPLRKNHCINTYRLLKNGKRSKWLRLPWWYYVNQICKATVRQWYSDRFHQYGVSMMFSYRTYTLVGVVCVCTYWSCGVFGQVFKFFCCKP